MKQKPTEGTYIYPDRHENITISLIEETEYYPGYWQKSEERILLMMLKQIQKKNAPLRLLDAGCGYGRLTLFFNPYFKEIIAAEPDIERFSICKQNLKKWKMEDKVKLYQTAVETLDYSDYFDVILCSHVFQHIPENVAVSIIQSFRKMLKKDGLLFITTTHSTNGEVKYCRSYMDKNEKRVEETIDQATFNNCNNEKGLLPVKFYTYGHLTDLLKQNRFEVTDYSVYHNDSGIQLLDKIIGTDRRINLNLHMKEKHGRDLYVSAIPR